MQYFLRPYTKSGLVPGILLLIAAGWTAGAGAQSLQIAGVLQESSLLLMHSHSVSYLGVDVGDVDQERSQALHLKEARGAEITVLDHDAPAGKVGLKLHDVILQVDSQTIVNAEQLKRILHETAPGKKLQLVVSRDGVLQDVKVELADRRKIEEQAREDLDSSRASKRGTRTFLNNGSGDEPGGFHLPGWGNSLNAVGVIVEPLTTQTADLLGLTGGVMIKNVARKSAGDAAGLREHDVILRVGGEAVVTMSDWERLLRSSEGKPVQVEILRDRAKQLVLMQVDGKRHKN